MTKKVFPWLALIAVLLAACTPGARASDATAIPTAHANQPTQAPATVSPPDLPTSMGCYYVWATKELPELTETIQEEFAKLNAGIQASAYAFGEECRRDDGAVTFLPMQTDFRVRIPVTTLEDDAALGAWISRAISVVETLPASEVPGTRLGRVEYEFSVDGSTGLRLTVETSRYRTEAEGLDSTSIFKLFQSAP